jgi:hypothetical protein
LLVTEAILVLITELGMDSRCVVIEWRVRRVVGRLEAGLELLLRSW